MQVLGVPVKLSDTPGGIDTPPPRLGEHTDAVLARDLGLEAEAIAALRAQGAI
jgi:crotonobetainyl-CoA:carnitine CoA-transferase CaiB-like acyl-CoA transferase